MAEINGSVIVKGDVTASGTFKDFKPEVLAVDPVLGTLTAPRIWFNSATNTLKIFNGAAIVDLGAVGSGGVTPEELATALEDYTTSAALTTLLGGYVTDGELATAIAGFQTAAQVTTAINTAVADFQTETEVEAAVTAALATYAQSADVTTEIATAVSGLASTTSVTNAIANALSGLDFQPDVLGLETDFAGVAGRYILIDGLSGITPTVGNGNDIVDVTAGGEATVLAYDVSVAGPGALVWNRAASMFYRWDGTTWAEFGGLTGFTAGDGIEKTGDVVSVKADGASIVVGPNGVKVGDLSATYVTPAALTTATADFATDLELIAVSDDVTALETKVDSSFFPYSGASATTHTITHNLGYQWPIVQIVDTATNKQITPDSIEFTSANELVVTLGVAAALKGSVAWLKA